MKERMKEFLDKKGLSAKQFAELIDIQPSSVSHMLSGRNNPSVEVVQKMLRAFPDMDIHYFLTGVSKSGELLSRAESESPALSHMPESLSDKGIQDSTSGSAERESPDRIVFFFKNGSFREYFPH